MASYLLSAIMITSAVGLWAVTLFLLRAGAARALAPDGRRRLLLHFGGATAAWLVAAVGLAFLGVFDARHRTLVPPIAFGVALPFALALLALNHSRPLAAAAGQAPRPWVVGVQVYRTLGILFLVLYAGGELPAVFALPAGIWDVLIGLMAPAVAVLILRNVRFACIATVTWNVLGILDLIVAVALGFLSSPGAFQMLAIGSPNTLITQFPLVLVPLFHVPISVLLHIVSLRQLRAYRTAHSRRAETLSSGCLTTACS